MAIAEEQLVGAAAAPAAQQIVTSARALRPWVRALIAYLLYQSLVIVLWAAPVFPDPRHRSLGPFLGDSVFYAWALRWTPWALLHGQNPIFSDRIFAPTGVNLAWTAFIPGPAVVMWPVTRLFGPIISYNVLMALSPALAAWAAYLVCNRVTRAFWPSLMGGYLFGFSTYMVGQMHGHVNLVLIFPVAIAVYLVVRRIEGSLDRLPFVAWLAVTLIGLFSISTELFATTVLFGGLAFACAIVAAGHDRAPVFRVGLEVGLACVIVGGTLLPFAVSALRHLPATPLRPSDRTSIDLLSPIVPRPGTAFGSRPSFLRMTEGFTARRAEDAGYLGVPLILMFALFAITERRRRATWGLVFVVLATALALGPTVHLAGRPVFTGADVVVTHIPLLLNATSQRFPAYTALAMGVIAAIWLRGARRPWGWLRWALVMIGAAALLPAVDTPLFYPTESVPAFITDGTYRLELQPDEIVFPILPTIADELLWQQAGDFSFRLPAAYIGALPDPFNHERRYRGLAMGQPNPYMPTPSELLSWLRGADATAVLLDDAARERFEPLLLASGLERVYLCGGVSLWREPLGGAKPRRVPTVGVSGTQNQQGGVVAGFQMPALDGTGGITWGRYAGHPLVMTFYTSACHCDEHLRAMQAFHLAHPDVGALAVASFTGSTVPVDVTTNLKLTYDIGVDQLGRVATSFYHPSPLPFTVLVGPDGRVLRIVDGPLDRAGFESLLPAEPA